MVDRDSFRESLRQQRPVIGTWSTLASPLVTRALACGGLDFVILDCEHGPFELGQVHHHASQCDALSCALIVRVPTAADWMVQQALDQGAHGVLVPHIQDKAEAEALVANVKYHPEGHRGFTPFTPAGSFSNRDPTYSARANRSSVCGVIIESLDGLKKVREVASVKGIDFVYFGAYDLSQDLGVPGQVRDDTVVEAISSGVATVTAAGKCPGGFVAESTEDIAWQLSMGIRLITFGVDSGLLNRAVEETVSWFRGSTRNS